MNTNCTASTKMLYKKITKYLHVIGVPLQVVGFLYLREAIRMCAMDNTLRAGSISKSVYPRIADTFNSSVSRVERSIRNVIDVFDGERIDKINSLIGVNVFSLREKPTNRMIICCLADKVNLDLL